MTAPNPAVGALPGWRGTDPDGGTWVRTRVPNSDETPWLRVSRNGSWLWQTQKAAEAAGLEPLHRHALSAAPAPLDPGNPEHLRRVAEFLVKAISHTVTVDLGDAAKTVRDHLVTRASYMDAEHAEAEQDAADRELAHEAIGMDVEDWAALSGAERDERVALVLAGIRAERARQEAGQ